MTWGDFLKPVEDSGCTGLVPALQFSDFWIKTHVAAAAVVVEVVRDVVRDVRNDIVNDVVK